MDILVYSFHMNWTEEKVQEAFGGKIVGSIYMQHMVYKTLLLLPDNIISYITDRTWFLSSPEDAWAITFRVSEVKEKALIFLSDELLRENKNQITYTILHEVGHVVLNHRNSINYMQTDSEITKQEEEADDFAKTYFDWEPPAYL